VPLKEGTDADLIDAGEATRWQRGEHVQVRPRAALADPVPAQRAESPRACLPL